MPGVAIGKTGLEKELDEQIIDKLAINDMKLTFK